MEQSSENSNKNQGFLDKDFDEQINLQPQNYITDHNPQNQISLHDELSGFNSDEEPAIQEESKQSDRNVHQIQYDNENHNLEEKKGDAEENGSSFIEYSPVFKTSTIPQHQELKNYLQNLLIQDPYNKFCVDCHHNVSSVACLTYGIFICQACAHIHKVVFMGRSQSQVKDIFNEWWDDYQLEAVSPEFGGNKRFFQLLQEYNIHTLTIQDKYQHKAVKYYARKLQALVDKNQQFREDPPAKDWNDRLTRASTVVQKSLDKYEKKILDIGDKIDAKIEEKGWRKSISGFFKNKFSKSKSVPQTGSLQASSAGQSNSDQQNVGLDEDENQEPVVLQEDALLDQNNSSQQPLTISESQNNQTPGFNQKAGDHDDNYDVPKIQK
ncbi:adp-ribosylation factor gtpase-activating [Stylonychia lemnae]|uniref:Adp-ribosylation factor gtpase-activating n=1 Tax=Stylonychia lemnae TaxID=5949 RepID=A0A078ACJ8_STYLE|nr:adp-ribosylation factor gtpase-activating [Stylonychia lemnae]|eukprot:CDW79899.1 adp-ribosylation factor gtpase-activating [Stylonychia lemnae]